MEKFSIKIVTLQRAIVWLLLFSGYAITVPYLPKDAPLLLLLGIGFLLFGPVLFYTLAVTKTEWTITKEEIAIAYSGRYKLFALKTRTIRLDKIVSCDVKWVGNYDRIKIKVRSGQTITFYHDPLSRRDDFDKLQFFLPDFVKRHVKKG